MGRSQDRVGPDSRWRFRSRRRQARHRVAGTPDAVTSGVPVYQAFEACPVAVDEAETSFGASSFTEASFAEAGFTETDLVQDEFTGADLRQAGFTETGLVRRWFTEAELIQRGFTETGVAQRGFTETDRMQRGFTGPDRTQAGSGAGLAEAGLAETERAERGLAERGLAERGLAAGRCPAGRFAGADFTEAHVTGAGRADVGHPAEGSAEAGFTEAGFTEAGFTEAGFADDREMVPAARYWGDDPFGLEGLLVSAERFITLFHSENAAGPPDWRLAQVRREILTTGTYRHTPDELEFGARVAWRNSSRCIGRLYWKSLRVRDRREVTSAADIAAECTVHLREATNRGKIRPVITIFAPDTPARPGPRILNAQLIQYAGYQTGEEAITGDPASADLTRLARALGWRGRRPAGRFDVLPLIIQEPGPRLTLHQLAADAVLEVPIRHPEFDWFAELGLRWHAVPAVSDMYLAIGGVYYPAAPFNGWYMCTEIGSRDLGDTARYDQLPVVARGMGLSVASDKNLWKDKATTELNLAVLHSYAAAGVSIADHHTESARFLQHMNREERQGRACPADWTWIVPPAASSTTGVFHRTFQDFDQEPNFYRHPPTDGGNLRITVQAGQLSPAHPPAGTVRGPGFMH